MTSALLPYSFAPPPHHHSNHINHHQQQLAPAANHSSNQQQVQPSGLPLPLPAGQQLQLGAPAGAMPMPNGAHHMPLPIVPVGGGYYNDGMELVWHGEFSRLFGQFYPPHVWYLAITSQAPPNKWKFHRDSAKVRFCCQDCGNGWTSMKGRVTFWFNLNFATNEGSVQFKLYGQQCKKCNSGKFEYVMWYPEEVSKVMCNVYHKVGQTYYGFMQPPIRIDRRPGRPRNQHNSDLCQACHDGECDQGRPIKSLMSVNGGTNNTNGGLLALPPPPPPPPTTGSSEPRHVHHVTTATTNNGLVTYTTFPPLKPPHNFHYPPPPPSYFIPAAGGHQIALQPPMMPPPPTNGATIAPPPPYSNTAARFAGAGKPPPPRVLIVERKMNDRLMERVAEKLDQLHLEANSKTAADANNNNNNSSGADSSEGRKSTAKDDELCK